MRNELELGICPIQVWKGELKQKSSTRIKLSGELERAHFLLKANTLLERGNMSPGDNRNQGKHH